MIDWEPLFAQLIERGQKDWANQLRAASHNWLIGHGDFPRWQACLDRLPDIAVQQIHLDRAAITVEGDCDQPDVLESALKGLMPWRKGPYQIGNVGIDTEWRSDLKWQRVLPHLESLQGKRILDVGCGNGYHCWRMNAEQPDLVLGVEPSVLFNLQFMALKRYITADNIQLVPQGIEALPARLHWFDTVFSMGVLYHRRSPIDHLMQLRGLLKKGGQLCLETLVIEGARGQVLVPGERYARMRNVWFIPSVDELANWLSRSGFKDIKPVDQAVTTREEQRQTAWMQFESLQQCLDENNPQLTVEGYPAPCRAVLLARAA